MRYEYVCGKCSTVFEVEKKMSDPDPKKCPNCKGKKIERYFSPGGLPSIIYAGRPIWTYNDSRKYKTFRQNGGPLKKMDPAKLGDLGSWHADAEAATEKPKKKRKSR